MHVRYVHAHIEEHIKLRAPLLRRKGSYGTIVIHAVAPGPLLAIFSSVAQLGASSLTCWTSRKASVRPRGCGRRVVRLRRYAYRLKNLASGRAFREQCGH